MKNRPPYLYRFLPKLHQSFQTGKNSILSLFFPWPCVVCRELQKYGDVLCEPCRLTLPRIHKRSCRICGAPFPDHWRVKICPECKLVRPKLTRIRSAFSYEEPVIRMIREMKFSRKARHARYFSEELYLTLLNRLPRTIGAIVPVPLHRAREWERTFDQSRLLGSYLQELSGIPLRNILERKKNTIPQTALSGSARRKNLQGAFQLKNGVQLPASILLVDDVITTGATLEACAAVLRKAGVRRVYGLTVARATQIYR